MFTGENVDKDTPVVSKSKRRKISRPGHLPRRLDESLFTPLLTGLENAKSVKARSDLFHATWSPCQASVDVRNTPWPTKTTELINCRISYKMPTMTPLPQLLTSSLIMIFNCT